MPKSKSAPWGRQAVPQVQKGIGRTTIPAMTGTFTNVSRIASSTGIYGLRISGSPDVRAVKVRGKRVPKGRGSI
jgi:hypothetical protein